MKNALILFTGLGLALLGCSKATETAPAPTPTTGTFTVKGRTYTGQCLGATNGAGSTTVSILPDGLPTFMDFYNMPAASSGTFPVQDWQTKQGVYTIVSLENYSYPSLKSGSVVKTGARSFTFSCTGYDIVDTTRTVTVTGSGSY